MSNQMVNWTRCDEEGAAIITYSEQEISNQLNKILELKKKVDWEGADSDAAMKEYTSFLNQLQVIADATKQYGGFMKAVGEKYRQTSGRIQNSFDR